MFSGFKLLAAAASSGRDAPTPMQSAGLPEPLLAAIAGALVLTASMANFLNHNEYPLLTPEVGVATLLLLLISGIVGLAYWASGRLLRTLLEVLLAYAAFDLNMDGTGVIVAAIAATILLNRYLVPMLGVTAAFVLFTEITTAAFGGAVAEAKIVDVETERGGPPAILHLILDEHIGAEGLDREAPETSAAREKLTTFYGNAGFRSFGGAYSEYMHTVNSIPQILNLGTPQPWAPGHNEGTATIENAYFDRLGAMGYALHVYQSDFIDYCQSEAVRSCTEYRASGLGPLASTALGSVDKSTLVLAGFFSLSDVLPVLGAIAYGLAASAAEPLGIEMPVFLMGHRTSATSALPAFDQLIEDLIRARPGDAYFAHLLIPHYPYALDSDCSLKEVADWQLRRSPIESREDRQIAYFDQLACATKKVEEALSALAKSEAGDRSIVIVHGDHGSRITDTDPTVENLETAGERDIISSFSTLFAVRAPGITAGYDASRIPVARLLSALTDSNFSSAEVNLGDDFVPTVMIENRVWKPVRSMKLPEAWARPPQS